MCFGFFYFSLRIYSTDKINRGTLSQKTFRICPSLHLNSSAFILFSLTHTCTSPPLSQTRLELTPWRAFPPFDRAPAEGGLSYVWHLSRRVSHHPQCLSGSHGTTGFVCDHAWLVSHPLRPSSVSFVFMIVVTAVFDVTVQKLI